MEDFLSRKEHQEFEKRMEDEHRRQNHRIELLEKATEQNNKLLISVERLALSMEGMQEEQKEQGEQLEKQSDRIGVLESRDGEKWRDAAKNAGSCILGILIGYILKQMGIF